MSADRSPGTNGFEALATGPLGFRKQLGTGEPEGRQPRGRTRASRPQTEKSGGQGHDATNHRSTSHAPSSRAGGAQGAGSCSRGREGLCPNWAQAATVCLNEQSLFLKSRFREKISYLKLSFELGFLQSTRSKRLRKLRLPGLFRGKPSMLKPTPALRSVSLRQTHVLVAYSIFHF